MIEETEFYHGTSIDGLTQLLPPSVTDNISEVGRKKNLDKVFFTKDINHARIYAFKASKIFGGDIHMYRVVSTKNLECMKDTKGASIYIADRAILEQLY